MADTSRNPRAIPVLWISRRAATTLLGADPSTLGVKAIDDWTFEVTMVGPRGLFPVIAGYAACFPCHPPSVDKFGAEYTDPAKVGGPIISNGEHTP